MDVTAEKVESDEVVMLGGEVVGSYGVADSPEFYQLLSDALYSNKILAAVREPLCNAWDSHVQSGISDTAVKVTYIVPDGGDEGEFIIQDFGMGIPHDKILEIYCIYGASTKKNSDDQTGGFGLGSKAPFAYSPHFTVTNCNAGIKRIYKILRVGENEEGKPDVIKVLEAPTDSSGITVSIPVRDETDGNKMLQYIKAVALYGGMKIEINSSEQVGVQWDTLPHGYVIVNNEEPSIRRYASALNSSNQIFWVKLGSVIYPISLDQLDMDLIHVDKVGKYLWNYNSGHHYMILNAPANSLKVVPSREALSYTPTTKTSLVKLLSAAVQHFTTQSTRAINTAITTLKDTHKNPHNFVHALRTPVASASTGYILSTPETIDKWLFKNYHSNTHEDEVIKKSFPKLRFLTAPRHHYPTGTSSVNAALNQVTFKELAKAFGEEHYSMLKLRKYFNISSVVYEASSRRSKYDFLLEKVIFFSYAIKHVSEYCEENDINIDIKPTSYTGLVFILNKESPESIAALKERCEKRGFKVVMIPKPVRKPSTRVHVPRAKPLTEVLVAELNDATIGYRYSYSNAGYVSMGLKKRLTREQCKNQKYVIASASRQHASEKTLSPFGRSIFDSLKELYPGEIVIVDSGPNERFLKKNGGIDFLEWLKVNPTKLFENIDTMLVASSDYRLRTRIFSLVRYSSEIVNMVSLLGECPKLLKKYFETPTKQVINFDRGKKLIKLLLACIEYSADSETLIIKPLTEFYKTKYPKQWAIFNTRDEVFPFMALLDTDQLKKNYVSPTHKAKHSEFVYSVITNTEKLYRKFKQ